jgi:hypothetical protein
MVPSGRVVEVCLRAGREACDGGFVEPACNRIKPTMLINGSHRIPKAQPLVSSFWCYYNIRAQKRGSIHESRE